jgi:hypothetical protein
LAGPLRLTPGSQAGAQELGREEEELGQSGGHGDSSKPAPPLAAGPSQGLLAQGEALNPGSEALTFAIDCGNVKRQGSEVFSSQDLVPKNCPEAAARTLPVTLKSQEAGPIVLSIGPCGPIQLIRP